LPAHAVLMPTRHRPNQAIVRITANASSNRRARQRL
jgi:hypothetical protein